MEQVTAGQFTCRLHLLPAYGTVVGVVIQVVLSGKWIALLHVVEHPQVIAVSLVLPLLQMERQTDNEN